MKVKKTVYDAANSEYRTVLEVDLPSPEKQELSQVQTLEERLRTVENSNAELSITVDSILTEVIPSLMGI